MLKYTILIRKSMMLQNGVIWIMYDIFIISSKNMKMNLKCKCPNISLI